MATKKPKSTGKKKARKKKAAPVTRPESYTFPYKFNKDELAAKSRQLAETCEDRNRVEEEKKSVMSDYKAKIDNHVAKINLLSQHINSGQEMVTKTVQCTRDFTKGIKTYTFNGKVVGEEPMMESEYQLSLEDQEAAEKKKRGRKAKVDGKSGLVEEIEQPKKKRGRKGKKDEAAQPGEQTGDLGTGLSDPRESEE